MADEDGYPAVVVTGGKSVLGVAQRERRGIGGEVALLVSATFSRQLANIHLPRIVYIYIFFFHSIPLSIQTHTIIIILAKIII